MTWKATQCRSELCRAAIAFLPTMSGAKIPVDVDEHLKPGDRLYEKGRHTPHHSTCKDVEAFRARR